MTRRAKHTSGLVGPYLAICPDALIHENSGISQSALSGETFGNARMNWMAPAEIALAVLVTRPDLFNRLPSGRFLLVLSAALLGLVLSELGKLVGRRQTSTGESTSSRSSSASRGYLAGS